MGMIPAFSKSPRVAVMRCTGTRNLIPDLLSGDVFVVELQRRPEQTRFGLMKIDVDKSIVPLHATVVRKQSQ